MPVTAPDWNATAFRWRKRGARGHLQAVAHPHAIDLDERAGTDGLDLQRLDDQGLVVSEEAEAAAVRLLEGGGHRYGGAEGHGQRCV